MKIYAISDMHGILPDPADCPETDLLLIGGDICPDLLTGDQFRWLDSVFRDWLTKLPVKHIVGIAGNHDFVFTNRDVIDHLFLPWTYLQDSSFGLNGIKVYGTPWVPNLPAWAFFATETKLEEVYGNVPRATDIVLSHGPPRGYGDKTDDRHGGSNVGSQAAADMLDRIVPQVYVCGHIHEARGYYLPEMSEVYNVSAVDANYVPVKDPFVEIIIAIP